MTDIPFRGIVLQQASQATLKTRHEVYGDPFTDMQCAAAFTALYRQHAGEKYHPAHDEAMARVFIKIARIACGIPGHTDSYVDAAAYMAIAAECQMTYRAPIIPMIDPDSPAKAFSDGKLAFKLGSFVQFGPKEEALWTIIRINNGDFGEFVAQHESSGGHYKGIAKHIYKVVTY